MLWPLPVQRKPLTWVHVVFCRPVGMHGRSLQVTSCTTAEVHQPQALTRARSQMFLSRGQGRNRAIVSVLPITSPRHKFRDFWRQAWVEWCFKRISHPWASPVTVIFLASTILQQRFLQVSYGYKKIWNITIWLVVYVIYINNIQI